MLTLRIGGDVAHRLSYNVGFGLLVDDEVGGFGYCVDGVFFDPGEKVLTGGDVVDEADDLAGGPYLQTS